MCPYNESVKCVLAAVPHAFMARSSGNALWISQPFFLFFFLYPQGSVGS